MIPLKLDFTYIVDYANVLKKLEEERFDIQQQLTCPSWWVDELESATLTARLYYVEQKIDYIGESS